MVPALDSVGAYLAEVDPGAKELLVRARGLASAWARPHTMPAFAAYAATAPADRDRLTVTLAELAVRVATVRPLVPGGGAYETARHELRLVVLLDQALRAQAAGAYEINARDVAMAETVAHVRRGGRRVVLGAANNHIQRIPVRAGGLLLPVLGAHLAAELGDAYVSIALTTGGGSTTTRRRAPGDPRGATVHEVALGEPEPDSVEAALGSGRAETVVADLRPLRGSGAGPQRIRIMDSWAELDVAAGFDLVAQVPRSTAAVPD